MIKAKEVQVGAVYMAEVTGVMVPVMIERASSQGGWDGMNLQNGCLMRIRITDRLQHHPRGQDVTSLAIRGMI